MDIIENKIQDSSVVMSPAEFADVGHKLVDTIASFLNDLPQKQVTTGESPKEIQAVLGNSVVPQKGSTAETVITEAAALLFNHSLYNGHPRFWGYITSSAAPIGILGDMLSAALNQNVGAFVLSPMATEIERQTVRWLAEMVGLPEGSGGVFVSGGNVANFTGLLAARKAKAAWDIRKEGLAGLENSPEPTQHGDSETNRRKKQMLMYCSKEAHTWIQKAADLFGFGTDAIRWIGTNSRGQIRIDLLKQQINRDLQEGYAPIVVVGTSGTVSTGTVDPLSQLAQVCKEYNLWFHVDGAYGAPAAMLPECSELFEGLAAADSIALDPHKWFYSPIEAGCLLVRNPQHLTDAFSFHPEYYNFAGNAEDPPVNFYDYGLQNSRGFRALKVWLSIKQAGKDGYQRMIRKDIGLARELYDLVAKTEGLEPMTQQLSITTFWYVPADLPGDPKIREAYLNLLNERLLNVLQAGGKVFLSHAIVNQQYCLRVCIVNFRTSSADLEALVAVTLNEGKRLHVELAGSFLKHKDENEATIGGGLVVER